MPVRPPVRPHCDPCASAPMDRTPPAGDAPANFTATVEVLGRRVEAPRSSTRASPGIEAMGTPGPVRPSQRPWPDPGRRSQPENSWERQKLPALPIIGPYLGLWGQIAVISVISGAHERGAIQPERIVVTVHESKVTSVQESIFAARCARIRLLS
jgi:hypothetical protein